MGERESLLQIEGGGGGGGELNTERAFSNSQNLMKIQITVYQTSIKQLIKKKLTRSKMGRLLSIYKYNVIYSLI